MSRLPSLALAVAPLMALSSCGDNGSSEFIASCQAERGFSETECSCVDGLITNGLEEKGVAYVRAIILGNNSEAARIQSSFGLLEGSEILARSAWIAANAPQACNVAI